MAEVAQLAFLRHNHHLFTKGALPKLADKDSIIAHRLESWASVINLLQAEHLQGLLDPFN